MAYTPQQWHDDTTDSPYGPISGARLNYIEAGIAAAAAAADAAGTASGGTSVLSTTGTATQTVVSSVAFTGAVTAPLVDKAGQVFNVKAYGALGDGSADDATAIQAAVDAAGAAGGGIVLFPTGVYKVNTGISVILPSVVFQGSGWDQSTVTVGSVLKAGASMTHLVNVSSVGSTFASQHMSYDGAGNATNCVTVDGLNAQFLQSHARHPATNGVGFNVTSNATSAWFTDCRFNGANQAGCVGWAINGTDSMLHGCKGVNCVDAVTYGSTASGGQQTGCHHTPGSTIGRCAINVAGNAANLILVGNRIDSHQLGSGIQVTPSANIVGLQIVSNTFYPGTALTDNTFAAIGLDTTSAHIYQCVINDNIIRSSASNRYAALVTAQTLAGSAATNPTRISGDGTTTNGNSVYAVAMYGTSSSPLMARGNVLSTDGTTYTAQSNIGALDAGGTTTPLGTAAPIIDGVAAAGSSGSAAHEDHVHPTDTSRAALASPTFSGTPSLPTASVGVTQSAADSSLKLATTAFVTTADNLKANLAGPTFTGTVTVPNIAGPTVFTGTATIPNIAGPTTLTGTVTLPSTTVAVTPSASDNSTKPATTAYVDTADALKANLAGPTFTGSPVLPTGTTGTTQSINDASTKLATTAYITAQTKATGAIYQLGVNTYSTLPIMLCSTSSASANAGDGRWARVQMGQSGVLHDVSCLSANGANANYNILILDDGQANGTHTVRTCLAIKGTTATPATGTWMTYDPSLTVAAGDTLVFMLTFSGTTDKAYSGSGGTGAGTMPNSSFLPGSGASTATQKLTGTCLSANVPAAVNGTVTDANMPAAAQQYVFVWRIT